jgi:hypothetical protein
MVERIGDWGRDQKKGIGRKGQERAASGGGSHDPARFPSCDKALMNANATARFEGGRLMVLLIHA